MQELEELGAFYVKTHLSQLLKQVEEDGKIIAITRHGRVVAFLTPPQTENPVEKAIESIRKNRQGVRLSKGVSLKSLIKEGRR